MSTLIPSTDVRAIPASQLTLSPFNVRKTGAELHLDELVCSIEAHGILQNLSVHPVVRKGRRAREAFGVFAGGRRWRAIQRLIAEKRIPDDFPVPCAIRSVDEAVELSLAENAHEPMHPADEFEAFCALIDAGQSIEAVAARFGVEPLTVRRRLKLARVASEFIELYREGTITLEHLYALALTDDLVRQRQVWSGLSEYDREPETIRKRITENELPLTSAVARFVGVGAYERAGGAIRRDLFAEGDSGYATDVELMRRLARERLEEAAGELRGNGAAFVEVIPELSYGEINGYEHVGTVTREATEAEQAEMKGIQAEREAVEAAMEEAENAEDENARDQHYERLDELDEKENELEERRQVPDPQQAALAGAIVTIDRDGKLRIEHGLLKPEDAKKVTTGKPAKAKGSRAASGHSAPLLRRLSAHRTLALRATLAQRPDVALVAITHRLVLDTFYPAASTPNPLEITATHTNLKPHAEDLDLSRAHESLQRQREALQEDLPEESEALFGWLLDQPQPTVLKLLAFAVALSVNGVQSDESASQLDALAVAAGLDMTRWWTPTAQGYFLSVPKAKVLEVVRKAISAEAAVPLENLKRAPMAAAAEKCLAGRGWLPDCLRGTAA